MERRIVAIRRPHDEDGLVADRVLDVVARRAELFLAAATCHTRGHSRLELEIGELADV